METARVQAKGPWALLEVIQPAREDGLQKTASGLLFVPDGNMEERLGMSKARVLSVGKGIWDEKKQQYEVPGFGIGDVVVFRGYLKEANPLSYLSDDLCFVHMQDVLGVWEE